MNIKIQKVQENTLQYENGGSIRWMDHIDELFPWKIDPIEKLSPNC